jgi:hypothetical protein
MSVIDIIDIAKELLIGIDKGKSIDSTTLLWNVFVVKPKRQATILTGKPATSTFRNCFSKLCVFVKRWCIANLKLSNSKHKY